MAKRNLLDLVQSILNDMTSDSVSSISDTTESEQVASIIKDTYFELINRMDKIPEHKELKQLTAVSDTDRPNYLRYPTTVVSLDWFKYNISETGDKEYKTVEYLTPDQFITYVMARDSDDTNTIQVSDFSGVTLLIQDNKMPQYWTSFDDDYIVCDSYMATIDSTLQASKTMTYCLVEPVWSATDDFVPDLDSNLFPLLLSEAKAMCFANVKQSANPMVDRNARRQLVATQTKKQKFKEGYYRPDFGRK